MKRLKNLTPFIVMDIVQKAARYDDTIHFEIGQPDLPPSPKVTEAARKAIEDGRFSYTQTEGLPALRQRIARHYKDFYDIKIEEDAVILTPGTSGAFLIVYAALLDIGDTIGFADPGYPSYKNFAYTLGIEPRFIPVFEESGYRITPEHLEDLSIDALQISNPANPTGNVYEDHHLQELAHHCRQKGIKLISDELYHGLTYETRPQSALAYDTDAIVINGFSKYFCMPGFRLGWIIVPKSLRRKLIELAQNLFIAPPTISQYAALEAFDYGYLDRVRDTFQKRRDFLYEALSPYFPMQKPKGAFYLWADISKYCDDGVRFCEDLLQKEHVALTPGLDFGKNRTQTRVRLSYTTSIEEMKRGVERIRRYLASLSAKT